MSNFDGYQISSADFRAQLRKNDFRSRMVMICFVLIYCAIGLIIDMFMVSESSQYAYTQQVPLGEIFKALITFQITPIATIILGLIAVVALFITYRAHNKLMLLGTTSREITPETAKTLEEKQLYNVVEEMKVAAGLTYMPKVYIIEADYMNAFASGFSEKSAMVAITRGLMQKLNRAEMQAVMAHELSHIRHHDIKLTLTAAVLSNITIMAIDVMFYGVLFSRRRRGDNRLVMVIMILRFVLPLITVLLMLYLSRTREFMADAGCVELMRDNGPMGSALLKIHQDHQVRRDAYQAQYAQTAHEEVRQAAYLYDPTYAGIKASSAITNAFSTHPSLERRLAAIGITKKSV